MVTSSTLKALKEEDGPLGPIDQPKPLRTSGLAGRLQTWQRSVWRHRWLAVATAWMICLVGWLAITLWPTSYNASAVIYANVAELVERNAAPEGSEQTPIAMLEPMLLSEEALDQVRQSLPLEAAEGRSLADDIMLRSTVPPVFVIAYEHADAEIARQVLEIVIARFEDRWNEVLSASLESAEELDQSIDDHQRRLQTSEAELVTFKRANIDYLEGAESRAAELAILEEDIERIEKQTAATIAKRDEIAVALARARAPEGDGEEPVRTLGQIETERKALEAELAKLQERYADTHPYVIAVFDAIKTLDVEAEALAQPADGDELPRDRDQLEQRHGELIVEASALNSRLADKRREIELLQALTRTTTSVEAELAELEANKGELESALADLRQRRDELGKVQGEEAAQETFKVIKPPELPTDPVGPSRLMALAVVLIGGAGLGVIAAVACNRYQGVFESAWQLGRRFDVGVLGTISEVMTPEERTQLGHARLAFGAACLALFGAFSGLAIAEASNRLAPLGDQLRAQFLG